MGDRFPLAFIGALVFLAVVGNFALTGARRGSFATPLSTFRSEPDGARALYLVLEQQRLPVSRWRKDLRHLDPQDVPVLLGVRAGFALDGLLDRFADAGTDDDPNKPGDDLEHTLAGLWARDTLDEDEREALLAHLKRGGLLVYAPPPRGRDDLLASLEVGLEHADPTLGLRTLVVAQPTRYTTGVQHLEAVVSSTLELPTGAVPLLVDEAQDAVVAAAVPHGQGWAIVLGAPLLAENRALPLADNALFWTSLFRELARVGSPAFDEYHHGFHSDRSLGEFAARYGVQYAVLQLLVGLALWALALRRFGRQKDVTGEVRVGATDALAATSRLYREGRHHAHAADAIVRELATSLASHAGVSTRSTPAEVGAALEVRGRADLARALLDVARAAHAVTSDAQLELVARRSALARRTLLTRRPKKELAPR